MVDDVSQAQHLAKAKERLAEAVQTQIEKSRAYDADPLFCYLWHAGWGTTQYSGRGLVRLIDGWVAKLCHFEKARAAYWLLNEIPQRLRKHIRTLER